MGTPVGAWFRNSKIVKKYMKSLVSTKKSYEDFEIVDIQFVVSKFGTQRFDFIFAVCIRLFEKFSQSKKSLYSATYWISSIIPRVSMVQVNWIYLIFNHVPFLVDSSDRWYTILFGTEDKVCVRDSQTIDYRDAMDSA